MPGHAAGLPLLGCLLLTASAWPRSWPAAARSQCMYVPRRQVSGPLLTARATRIWTRKGNGKCNADPLAEIATLERMRACA